MREREAGGSVKGLGQSYELIFITNVNLGSSLVPGHKKRGWAWRGFHENRCGFQHEKSDSAFLRERGRAKNAFRGKLIIQVLFPAGIMALIIYLSSAYF